MTLLQKLQNEIVVGDGAMGTLLYSHGVDQCFESFNLTNPEQVQRIHQSYIAAGANVIQTNTYGANFIKLSRYGLEEKVHQLNQQAVKIAKRAANEDTAVLGTIGGIRGVQKRITSKKEIIRSFQEQFYTLLSAGVDGILLETYYDMDELMTILKIAREETSLPIVTNVSMHEPGILENGTLLADALHQLEELGSDVVGVNCRLGPHHMLEALETVPIPNHAHLAAYPNASFPAYENGKLVYHQHAEYFKQCAASFREQGVRLIGGCCGTTPEHIAAINDATQTLAPITSKQVKPKVDIITQAAPPHSTATSLKDLAKERHTVIVELDAPKHLDTSLFFQGVRELDDIGVDAITLADNSLATPRISNTAIAMKMREIGIKTKLLIHLTCRDRNLIGLQSHLMGLHTLGFNEILAITGDPTRIGGFPGASSVFDVTSGELTRLIKQCNQGRSFAGTSLQTQTNFHVAGALNANVQKLDRTIKRMKRKINNGTDYFLTQPIFTHEKIISLYRETQHLDTPIFVGIMPLISHKNAEFLHHEVPGIGLSDEVRARMQAHRNKKDAKQEGLQIAKELIDTAIHYFHGIYLVTPFMDYHLTVELTKYIHDQTKNQSMRKEHVHYDDVY
ncbi:bifunctional homocysteine S-methyltransferase/5,10-methylenetetrahydrofolate reductase protein [Gracilibacillus halophilus YIM-C55.5]|uniref:Bifunctional homocysteine S-methyltransferase/5,10-methylenetetrahydrofolate reductase protein n=1 Tax=Gracilibacillus halophilus YIM-C55.5 TaxID=1308866 RepID=N4WEM7_9BACI|nr:bifunctional homocysteine S-methyltransferase/methylenetetrahydrofolate reductase [Gracilibacillus halophilus]ENH97709.1 bifunctional homocysteine S-methyltransferase/5,10-methylenetetrahydrofolate reductase protein [Gracilibacillus halophilus YIM-C55.5]